MTIENTQFEMYAGNKRTINFIITDEDLVTPAVMDVSSYTIRWALTKATDIDIYKVTPVLEKISTTGGHMDIVDANVGDIDVILLSADTSGLSAGLYRYELEIDLSSEFEVVAVGLVEIKKNVSNTL